MIGSLTAGQFAIFDTVMELTGAEKFHFHDPSKALSSELNGELTDSYGLNPFVVKPRSSLVVYCARRRKERSSSKVYDHTAIYTTQI